MQRNGMSRLAGVAAGLIAAAGLPVSARAMQAEAAASGAAASPDRDADASAPQTIRFSFSGAPFSQVFEFFARQTGLPVIYEAGVPGGTLTFISAEDYSLAEALEILNLNLGMHNVRLVRRDNFLYLRTTEDAAKKAGAVLELDAVDGLDPTEFVTVTVPLSNAAAPVVLKQIEPLIKAPGMAQAIPAQNMIVVVETVDQVKRLRELIQHIDAVRPVDSEYKIFNLRHAQAEQVVGALKGLVGQRIQKQIIEKDGSIRQVEEIDLAGLSIEPDKRLNAIVAVGASTRLQTVEELIGLLDQPEGGVEAGETELATFALEGVTAGEAKTQVEALFRAVPKTRQPTLIALDDVSKLVVVGEGGLVRQAGALIGEMDPRGGASDAGDPERVARVVPLDHATAPQVEQIARRMLSPRQLRVLTFAASPTGSGLLVAGPAGDVADLERLIDSIDVQPDVRREIRQVVIRADDARAVVAEAERLDSLTDEAEDDPVRSMLDAESGTVTLIGSRAAIQRFEQRLRDAEQTAAPERRRQVYSVERAEPSQLAGRLKRLLRPMLDDGQGGPYREPTLEGLDELDQLVVVAEPDQFAVIDALVERLDAASPGDQRFQVIRLTGPDPERLIERARELYAAEAEADPTRGEVSAEIDSASGSLLVRGAGEDIKRFAAVLQTAQQLTPPARTTRLVDVRNIEAEQVIGPLRELLESADPIDPARAVPAPTLKVVEETNSLVVTAEDAQHRLIADFVRRLDTVEQGELPPLRLLQLRSADVNAVAQMLTQQYSSRPLAERTTKPVQVRADAATGTLIVSAHEDLFGEIKSLVEQLNAEGLDGPERETFIFPLKVARAVDVAAAMDRLYPQPPMPVDRFNRPMPWLQQPKEVTVSADASSNALIIDAPSERRQSLEQLAETLDRVQAPPIAELRTYRIVRADLRAVSQMLQGLARRGSLSAPAQAGKQAVEVVIEIEPRSNTLIVAGDEVTFDKVEAILADLTAVPVERALRIVPIANADAAAIRDRALSIYDAQIAQIDGAGPVDITIDEATNSLEVVADADAMDRFMGIIDELQQQVGPAREVRLIELKLAPVGEVIAFLRELVSASESLNATGGPEPVFEPIESTNSIMAAAQPDQFPVIEALVRSLDNRQTADRPPLRILRLRSTNANDIAQVLDRSYSRRPAEERALKPVEIEADAATNTLIVSAHSELMPEIESVVSELNEAQAYDREGREIRIFPLKVARAEELARTIDQMYPEPPMPRDRFGRPMPQLQEQKEVFVRADAATNSLIVDAPAQRLAGFEQIVQSLDTLTESGDVELRTYTVTKADLNAVSQTLRQLASSGALGATGRTPVTVSTEPASRTLIVSGPSGIFDRVDAVVAEVDGSADRPATGLRMYRLERANAERVAEIVRPLLVTRLREAMAADGAAMADEAELIELVADRASNTIILSAPQGVQEVAEQLIAALDTEGAAVGRAVVRVVPLTFADASQVARTITQAIPGLDLPSGGPVNVVAATGSNALLLTGSQADLKKVEELIEPLDKQPFDPEKPSIETIALEHADAEQVRGIVESLLIDQQQTDPRYLALQMRYARGVLPQKPTIRVEAEARTNSLIVSGPAETIELARAVIERLDQPSEDVDRRVMTFTPANAEPARLADAVSRVIAETMSGGRRPVEVVADAGSGTVLVFGDDAGAAQAMTLLADFDDRTPVTPIVEVRSFELRHAGADAVAASLRTMLSDRARWPDAMRRAAAAGVTLPDTSVQVDRDSNRLIVGAASPLLPLASELVSAIDQPRSEGAVDVRVFRLTSGDAESVAGVLRSSLSAGRAPGEPEASVTAEATSNSVVVSASPSRLAIAEQLIGEMDTVASEPAEVGVKTMFLQHARAETVAPIVERVLLGEQGGQFGSMFWLEYELQRDRIRRGMEPERKPEVRVAAEPRLNAVVVSAPLGILELAEEVIAGLDVDPDGGPGGGRSVRVLPLQNADASSVAENLSAVFDDEESGAAVPTIRVDLESNALIVGATAEQMATIERLAGELDDATMSVRREMRTIPIDRSKASAAEIAQTLERMLRQRGGVRVEVLSVDELLSKPAEPEQDSSIAPWRAPVMPSVIEAALSAAFAFQPEEEREAEPTITIAVDPETNAIVVIGAPRLTERLATLAAELQQQLPAEPSSVRIIDLPDGVSPGTVAYIVTQTAQEVGTASAENPGGFTGRVAAVPDWSGNAVIVWANDTDFEVVSSVIAGMARGVDRASMTLKVYPLVNVGADDAARSVRDLVSPSPVGRQARRIRDMDVTIRDADGTVVTAELDPATVSVTAAPTGTSLIITAPDDAFTLIDRFVGLIDQNPVTDRMAIKRYDLGNARAGELASTVQNLMDAQRQGPSARDMPRARVIPDPRTNSLLVTATSDQHAEIGRLIAEADVSLEVDDLETAIIPLEHAAPQTVQRIVEQVIVGRDPAKAERIQISAQNDANLFVVKATAADIAEIREIVARVDVTETGSYPLRSIKLETADAGAVAGELQRFFQQRARVAGRRGANRSGDAAIIGDTRSGTLVIAASDEDYEQIVSLAEQFDAPATDRQSSFKIIQLENARATELIDTLNSIVFELQWERMYGRNQQNAIDARVLVSANEATDSILIFGQGEIIETIESVIAELDLPLAPQAELIVKAVRVENGDLRSLGRLIEEITGDPNRPWWRSGRDEEQVTVEVDTQRRLLILVGKRTRVEMAEGYVRQLVEETTAEGQQLVTIPLQHADANRAARSLTSFFQARARAEESRLDGIAIIGSPEGNLLIVSAPPDDVPTIRELVEQIDRPELGDDRRVEVYRLVNSDAREAAGTLRSVFPSQGPAEDRVIITPQGSMNALIVSAPEDAHGDVLALIEEIERLPTEAQAQVVAIPLTEARASDIAASLTSALPETLKVQITPDQRTNALMVTGSPEAIDVVRAQVALLDVEIDRQPLEFRRFELEHVENSDLTFTLRAMVRNRPRGAQDPAPGIDPSYTGNVLSVSATPDEMQFIEEMIRQLDVPPSSSRRTEFVKLDFADAEQASSALTIFFGSRAPEATTAAEREVSIYSDEPSNSLVISADEDVWERIRGLLEKIDTPEYDTSRQLVVMPLKHADAVSVARALNEGFRNPLEQEVRRDEARDQRRGGNRQDDDASQSRTVLVSAEETPSVSAEAQTNTLVVFASRADLDRIRAVVEMLDVPDFQRLPEPRLIAVSGPVRPTALAASVNAVFSTAEPARRGSVGGPNSTLVVGDDAAGVLIVRADADQFTRIEALVRALQEESADSAVSPRLIRLARTPAVRLQRVLLATFQPVARQRGETIAIEADVASNTLIVASSGAMFQEVKELAMGLDGTIDDGAGGADPDADAGDAPAGYGRSLAVLRLESLSPEQATQLLNRLGLTRPQPADVPGLVSEPIVVVPLVNEQSISVLASPADLPTVESLVRLLDREPIAEGHTVRIVPLNAADASAVVPLLESMLTPAAGDGRTPVAASLAEQVRRMSVSRAAEGKEPIALDLAEPIKLLADNATNAVVIASSAENAEAVAELVTLLDRVPVGDAVVVRFFPLENASADRVRQIVDDLFRRGEALSRLPGTRRQPVSVTATGQALASEIAVSVDERTNAIIAAGREEAVALVEVLVAELDRDDADRGWVETGIIELEHADAVVLSRKLQEVLIQGIGRTPAAAGLQQQVGRLRILADEGEVDPRRLTSDLFVPLTGLVITPEENLNALLVVGTPSNIAIVRELAGMLDVEQAAAANSVRVIPLEFASADRVADVVRGVFDERGELEAVRDEDRLIMSVDSRTNALIVSTSPRSFEILDGLIKTLDAEETRYAVGFHVIPVVGADVRELAPKIQRLMEDRLRAARSRGGVDNPRDAFSIEPVPASDLLIVAASDENLALVRELVDALTADGEAVASAERIELIPLSSAGRAAEVAEAIGQLYVDRENERRGGNAVRVVPSDRQNALLVSGTDEDIEAVRKLASELDVAQVETVQVVKRIPLRAANAFEIVTLVREILAGRAIGGRGGAGAAQATRLRFIGDQIAAGESEATIDAAIREQVRLTPDLRTNSVMVSAPAEIMELIESIITDLDAETSGDRKIEQFRLVNADAQQMALLLRDLFNLQQQGDRLVLVPRSPEPGDAGESIDGEPSLTPVPDQRQALAITIDRRTNTLLVSGTAEYLAEVRRVVMELDNIEANERDRLVYELNNATAKEVEDTLRAYFQGEAELRRSTLGPQLTGSLARQLEQEVTVVGDEKSNKLLISASPRYIDTVASLVQELDAAPPQVLIQVLLAEVTLDDEFTWGIDFNVGLDTATSKIGGDGYVFNQLAAGAGVATALGVPNFSVLSQDFRLLVRALEVQGRLEVLSRPHVTVRNNEDARIQVGADVGIVVGSDRVGERVSAEVERRKVGIILNVRPSISPDGTVRMDIAPEISSVSARTTEISEDFASPIIDERKVETTVTVGDGQTIVIGGLIQTRGEEREAKVPLVGDLPLIGGLFRSTQRTSQKTELMVILTPVVIPGDQGAADLKNRAVLQNKLDTLADPANVVEKMREDRIDINRAVDSWWESESPGDVAPEYFKLPPAVPPDLRPDAMDRGGEAP